LPEKHPVFPDVITPIGRLFTVVKRGNQVFYLDSTEKPVRAHLADDLEAFKALVSEFYVFGHFTQADIVRVFGVSAKSVRAAVKVYLDHGVAGFFRPSKRTAVESKPSIREQIAKIRLENAEGLELLAESRKDRP
jgi:predicted transcriptional regulator